ITAAMRSPISRRIIFSTMTTTAQRECLSRGTLGSTIMPTANPHETLTGSASLRWGRGGKVTTSSKTRSQVMWKVLESLGVKRERNSEVQTITNRVTAFRLHYDHAMTAAAELQQMIAASQRDLNDAFMRLRAAVPTSPPTHLISEGTEASEAAPATNGNSTTNKPGKNRNWSSAA